MGLSLVEWGFPWWVGNWRVKHKLLRVNNVTCSSPQWFSEHIVHSVEVFLLMIYVTNLLETCERGMIGSDRLLETDVVSLPHESCPAVTLCTILIWQSVVLLICTSLFSCFARILCLNCVYTSYCVTYLLKVMMTVGAVGLTFTAFMQCFVCFVHCKRLTMYLHCVPKKVPLNSRW